MATKSTFARLALFLGLLAGIVGAGGAHAQSSVTLYGVLDTYVAYSNNNRSAIGGDSGGKSAFRMASGGLSGTRWGLRGVEDLGEGLKALYAIESGFNSDDGTLVDPTRLFNRQSFVGLNGTYGQLTFGRQYTTLFDMLADFMPMYYAGTYEPFMVLTGPLRADNALKYRVSVGGLTVQAHYGFGEQPGSAMGSAAWGGGISYASGRFGMTAVYDQVNSQETAAGFSKMRKVALASSYGSGPVRLVAGYRWGERNAAGGATELRDDMWWAGLGYQVTPALTVTAAFFYDDIKPTAKAANAPNAKQYVLQGVYSLSKRTELYGAVAYSRDAALNFAALNTLANGKTSQTGTAVGIRHKF